MPSLPRALLLSIALLVLAAPVAAAQNASTDELPTGHEAPGPAESIERAPGMAFGAFVVIATVAFSAAFIYAASKYARRKPPMRP